MNSMKPICEFGLFSFSRSFKNCTGIPSIFSWSPWAKNSSKHTIAQARVVSQALHGLETSAECNMHSSTSILVSACVKTSISAMLLAADWFPSTLLLKISWFIWYVICKSFTIAPCPIMSVCKMTSMQFFRASRYCSFDNLPNTFICGSPTSVYSLAQCMFSRGDRSLYCNANSWPTSDKNPLLTPGWPRSCASAAISNTYCSSSVRKVSELISVINRDTPCKTSMACAKLWKGTGRYSFSTAPTKRWSI
mmetsp:Transcript_97445/g.297757  ORF Transcript_97445/g.297757 Transcript_97445/m.297757 type:complete len:250 (+) Transcript_97445:522-1271(+)